MADDGSDDTLLNACRGYVGSGDGDALQLATAIKDRPPTDHQARELLALTLPRLCSGRKHVDNIAAAVLSGPAGAQLVANEFLQEPTKIFNRFWEQGEVSFLALIHRVLLNSQYWTPKDEQTRALKYMFTLLLAKILEAGVDHPETALYSIARLAAHDAENLASAVDHDIFHELFEYLGVDESDETRSQATLVIAKMFEIDPKRTESELSIFMKKHVASRQPDGIAMTCSAIATLFPVMTSVASNMILQEGFLPILMQLVNEKQSRKLRLAALNLLSAACQDGACRKSVREHCDGWAWHVLDDYKTVPGSAEGAAASILVAKLRADQQSEKDESDKFVKLLKGQLQNDDTFDQALEALSYWAMKPETKKAIADDTVVLKRIAEVLTKESATPVKVYAGLQLFSALTYYPPALTDEQKKLLEVRAYADGSKPPSTHPLDEDGPVSDRCKALLDTGASAVLIIAVKTAKTSPALLEIVARVIACLSKHPRHRGTMVQQGLFDVCITLANMPDERMAACPSAKRNCALAIARILVPLDPMLVFAKRPVERAIDPLVFLLGAPAVPGDTAIDERWWRGFPMLNALQSLANLATLQGTTAATADHAPRLVVERAWPAITDAFTSPVSQLRVAATELLLNLAQSTPGRDAFAGEGAPLRWRILAAYLGDTDIALRRAAGGALAALVVEERGADAFVGTPNGVAYLCEALEDDDEGMRMRGVVVLAGLCEVHAAGGELGEKIKKALVKDNVKEVCGQVEKEGRVPEAMGEQFAEVQKALSAL